MQRDHALAPPLQVGVYPVFPQEGIDLIKVLPAKAEQGRHLIGPHCQPMGKSVGEGL